VQVHIRVGKKAASTSNPPDAGAGGLISEGTRRVARRFPNTVQLPLELTVVPRLTQRYRRSNLEAVHAWWLRWGDSSLRRSESVEWVPFLYLALDLMISCMSQESDHWRTGGNGQMEWIGPGLSSPLWWNSPGPFNVSWIESLLEAKPGFYLQWGYEKCGSWMWLLADVCSRRVAFGSSGYGLWTYSRPARPWYSNTWRCQVGCWSFWGWIDVDLLPSSSSFDFV
jgi:hypothetical protein